MSIAIKPVCQSRGSSTHPCRRRSGGPHRSFAAKHPRCPTQAALQSAHVRRGDCNPGLAFGGPRYPYAERLQQDRALGRRAPANGDAERVLAWWRATGAGSAPRYGVAPRLLTIGGALVGLLLGVGVALTAFHYDGEHPINIFVVLGLTVALPGLLMLQTLLAALPLGATFEQGYFRSAPYAQPLPQLTSTLV